MLNRGFLPIFLFSKPCSPPFYTTFASNSYIPPTFLLENVFIYFRMKWSKLTLPQISTSPSSPSLTLDVNHQTPMSIFTSSMPSTTDSNALQPPRQQCPPASLQVHRQQCPPASFQVHRQQYFGGIHKALKVCNYN